MNYHNSLGHATLYTRLTTAKVLLSARLIGSTVWIACRIRHLCTIIPRLLIAPIMYVSPASGIFCKTSRTTLQRSSSGMSEKVFLGPTLLAIGRPNSCRLRKIVRYETPVSQQLHSKHSKCCATHLEILRQFLTVISLTHWAPVLQICTLRLILRLQLQSLLYCSTSRNNPSWISLRRIEDQIITILLFHTVL